MSFKEVEAMAVGPKSWQPPSRPISAATAKPRNHSLTQKRPPQNIRRALFHRLIVTFGDAPTLLFQKVFTRFPDEAGCYADFSGPDTAFTLGDVYEWDCIGGRIFHKHGLSRSGAQSIYRNAVCQEHPTARRTAQHQCEKMHCVKAKNSYQTRTKTMT